MDNISPLFQCIFFGDFGLLTLTPRYLFLVLFPVMAAVGIARQLLFQIPALQKSGSMADQFFFAILGMGCTTAALSNLNAISDSVNSQRILWMLVLLIPCSAQLTLLASFASLVTLRVFLVFLFFFFLFAGLICLILRQALPLSQQTIDSSNASAGFHPLTAVREAFFSVCSTAVPFCAGSLLISLASFFGLLNLLAECSAPFLEKGWNLPPMSASLLLLNILKRDFGAAYLLHATTSDAFDACQLVVIMIMMMFSPPCFNATVLLVKQKGLPEALSIWVGSLLISLFFGKTVSVLLGLLSG